jgi:hypothetical protein
LFQDNYMTKKTWYFMYVIGVVVLLLNGCLPATYDHSALCVDRDVLFCEDFETPGNDLVGIHSESFSSSNSWGIMSDDVLDGVGDPAPVEGRSQDYSVKADFSFDYYYNDSATILYTAEIDLTDATSANLYFNLLVMTEEHWDGMIVFALQGGANGADDPDNWILIEPTGGYPDTVLFDTAVIPGYSGVIPYWTHEEFDLFPVLGSKVFIIFYFVSDFSIGEWGVALDDIVVDADTRQILPLDGSIPDLPLVDISFPHNPLLSTDIVGTIALVDTPCIGETKEILEESQRVYTKAINPAGDKYLVLHSDTGNFCWVNKEDVWIDGNDWDLPQVSDLKLEDQYLPFCSLSKTSVLDDPACLSSTEGTNGNLSYHLSRALIENGRITTMLIEPGLGLDPAQVEYDPRISKVESFPAFDPVSWPEGNLAVRINDHQEVCAFDTLQPGRVVCEDLSIKTDEPVWLELCWLGWDGSQGCPPGYSSSLDNTDCILPGESDTCNFVCPIGYLYSEEFRTCLINRDPALLSLSQENCPEGYRVNPEAECCLTPAYEDHFGCPDGFVYLAQNGSCLRQAEGEKCPEGLTLHQESGTCSTLSESPPPICSEFEVQFPKPEVTVKNSTRCWKGPGRDYENVSSLSPFSVVEVLGLGEGGEFLVINNPKYQAPCWSYLTDFYSDKLDLTILPVISISPAQDQPSESNGQTQGGCLVQEDMTTAPKCVVPCPDPEKYTMPCTP